MSSNGHPTVKIETFSVDQLKAILKKQRNPRKLKERHVNRLAKLMGDGRFHGLNGQTIVIAPDGSLVDGQHRAHAAVLAGVPLTVAVLRGASEGLDELDTGPRRTFSDVLGGRGWGNPITVAGAVRAIHYIRLDLDPFSSGGNTPMPSNSELLTTLGAMKRKLMEWCGSASQSNNNGRIYPPSVMCAVLYQAGEFSQKKMETFYELARSGDGLSAGHPIFALRRYFIGAKAASGVAIRRSAYGVLVKAWNLYAAGATSIKLLALRADEALPVVEKP